MLRSALVVLIRPLAGGTVLSGHADDLEVFLVERSARLRAFAGCYAFPGGCTENEDAGRLGLTRADEDLVLACAIRELFEETGVLLLDEPQLCEVTAAALSELRHKLLAVDADASLFWDFVESAGYKLARVDVETLTRLVTPKFSRRRYDTTFFLTRRPAAPSIVDGELTSGGWFRPSAALAAWRGGEIKLAAPIVAVLEEFLSRPLDEAIQTLRACPSEFDESDRAVAFAPGYEIVPLKTPPLPETTPTNAFLVGDEEFIVVDPAPREPTPRRHLLAVIERRVARGHTPLAVVLTHHHPDHVGALDAVAAQFELPVWAHATTAELLKRPVDRVLADGDRIALGRSPDGRRSWELEVLFTPGHAAGHIALYDRRHGSALVGDLVSTIVSMYVGSPGGDLADYFDSLRRIGDLDAKVLYPSHGSPSEAPAQLIEGTLKHRHRRIEQCFQRLDRTPRTVGEIAAVIYPSVHGRMLELTERTTRAALEYLAGAGRARRIDEDTYVRLDGRQELHEDRGEK